MLCYVWLCYVVLSFVAFFMPFCGVLWRFFALNCAILWHFVAKSGKKVAKNGQKLGKKWPILSRMGELLKGRFLATFWPFFDPPRGA